MVFVAGGAVAGAFELSGDWMHDKLDGIPVVSNVLNPVVDIWTGIGEIGSNVVHATSETVEDLGEMVDKLGRGDFVTLAANRSSPSRDRRVVSTSPSRSSS